MGEISYNHFKLLKGGLKMPVPKPTDICLSIRSVRSNVPDSDPKSWAAARGIIKKVSPTRIEWSYVRDRDKIDFMKDRAKVFVSSLNTISPPGHALDFDGQPCIAPWMRKFGSPGNRKPYICMNNPTDLENRCRRSEELISDGVTDTFQFDDWYGNAQMFRWPQTPYTPTACFCSHCMREFGRYLGLDINYREYLVGRGIRSRKQLFAMAEQGEVPLWDDFKRFAEQSVYDYLRRLRQTMARHLGEEPTLSVNATVNFDRIDLIKGLVDYLHGETRNFSPQNLYRMAALSREKNLPQVVSMFPDVPAREYHSDQFVARIRRAIAVCYALEMVPLFPWDVYAGDQPRWYGRWEEYRDPYQKVRESPHWLEDYRWTRLEQKEGKVIIFAELTDNSPIGIKHIIEEDGTWEVEEVMSD